MSLRCIAESHCRAAETASDGTREGAVTTEPDTLCESCMGHITSCVAQLPKDWEELHAAIGESSRSGMSKVRSTPTPAMPISAAKAALMGEIVEWADRAAAIVSERLRADQPTGRRNTAPTFAYKGEEKRPETGSAAANAEQTAKADQLQRLRSSVAIVEPHVDKLASAPTEAVVLWDRGGEDNGQPIERDPQTLEPVRGRGRIFTDMSGLDVALDLVDLHNKARAELGKTRLRHKYGLPCPRCGGEVGRDDGQTIIDCKNPACKGAWTEREFRHLQYLIVEDMERDILKYLLAESYWRLDKVQELIDVMAGDERIDLPGAGTIILDQLKAQLDGRPGHQKPQERQVGTDRAAAKGRQLDEDNWSWRTEKPYRPPKRKPAKPKKEPEVRYAPSSLTLLADIDENPVDMGAKCSECNEVHVGDCA